MLDYIRETYASAMAALRDTYGLSVEWLKDNWVPLLAGFLMGAVLL